MRSTYMYLLRPALLGLAMLGFALTTGARAGNIVQDGGFELADPNRTTSGTDYFSGGSSIDGGFWYVTQGTVGVDTDNQFVYAGQKSVFLNGDSNRNGTGPDSLTQTLTTTAGQLYTISFWANADLPNTLSVTFGGVTVTGSPFSVTQNGFANPDPRGNSALFTFYSGTALATSNSTDLTFTITVNLSMNPNLTNTVEIDNVSVTAGAVPEPSTLVLATIGGIGSLAYARRRRQG